MQPSSLISLSPSFNSYSSENLAQIAARVVQEFEFAIEEDVERHEEKEEEEEFEFATVAREPEASPISADDIFYNGQIRPIYPLFNTALLLDDDEISKSKSRSASPLSNNGTAKPIRLPLGKFFSEDRETASCSSSEADEIENVPADSYCVWTPKKKATEESLSDGRGKKSSSTGTSKRWKFRDLLYRSNSEGKENYVFLSPAVKKSEEEKKERVKTRKGMVEKHYVKSRALKGSDKRRSFLPYRPDLVGLFLPQS
ncbi:uncharacterized protein [Euphorbia lathyris]|uniref:uncharacterized protein n=1 Tax=Euphorbia lathyris TaxID=212925 RepID=UPI0033133020